MKKIWFITLFAITACFGEEIPERILSYFNYLATYSESLGPIGNFENGEIELILDVEKMLEIENTLGRQVGIIAEDSYWIWINDAVRFPNGHYGVYGRLLWRHSLSGAIGVAIVPMLPDGKICLNRNYRHATRSWKYELPRGCVDQGETLEEAAIRELKEETGMLVKELFPLGSINSETGMTNAVVPIFLGYVAQQGISDLQEGEAIAEVEAFTLEELKAGFRLGYLLKELNGNLEKISLEDPFLAFALFQMENLQY